MIVSKYRLRCTTEGVDKFVWGESAPTQCPDDSGHTIDSDSIVVIQILPGDVSRSKIVDTEGLDPDQAITCTEGLKVPITNGQALTTFDFSKPFPVDVTAAEYFVDYDGWHRDDYFEAFGIASGDPLIGALTAAAALDDTVINVSPTVFENARPGMFLEFQGHADVPYCINSMDSGAGTVTLCRGLEQAVGAGSEVRPRRPFILNKAVKKNAQRRVGDLQSGSSALNANDTIRIYYHHGVTPTVDDYINFVLIYLF
jgi:hypothetical protein